MLQLPPVCIPSTSSSDSSGFRSGPFPFRDGSRRNVASGELCAICLGELVQDEKKDITHQTSDV